jgi:putative sigma-54 modulation protein
MEQIENVVENEIPVKTKRISPEATDLDGAIAQMELLGHSFFIYKDIEDNKVAVVYKRFSSGYGLIEIE